MNNDRSYDDIINEKVFKSNYSSPKNKQEPFHINGKSVINFYFC